MAPVVIVEVLPPEPAGVRVEALLDACSAGSDGARCEAATDPEPPGTIAVAIVRWQGGDELSVRVEVGLRREGGMGAAPEWRARTLTFRAADSRVERWRAAGLTIATLAFAPEEPTASSPPSDRSSPPAPSAGAPEASPPPSERSPPIREAAAAAVPAEHGRNDAHDYGQSAFWVGVGGVAGPGIDDGVRLGFVADAGYRFASPAFVRLALGLAWQPSATGLEGRDVSLAWTTATLGGGLAFDLGAVSLLPRVALRIEGLTAKTDGPPEDSQAHFLLGAEVGADALLNIGRAGVFVGATAYRNRVASEIRIGENAVGRDGAYGWALTIGFRYRFSSAPPSGP
jgi:hypothetical protein